MKVESLIPVLDVRDVDASVSFYCEVLGFQIQDKVEWSGRTEWALLQTDKVQLMLCANDADTGDEDHRVNDGIFFLNIDNPEALMIRLKGAEIPNVSPPEAQLGNKDFYLRDPDGYILWFSYRRVIKDAAPQVEVDTAQLMPPANVLPASTVTPNVTSTVPVADSTAPVDAHLSVCNE
jgi:catechol 2,3-dioxygenase-like lactoylglutathione lyase family enzyme